MDFGSFKRKMHLEKVKHDELISVLLGHFGRIENVGTLPGMYTFQKEGDSSVRLKLGLDKKGQIVSIEPINVTIAEFNEIEKKVNYALIDDQKDTVAATVLFSVNLRVNGWFRYKDQFQILPMSPDAPRINYVFGDHPFILEYKYISSPDTMIDVGRRRYQESLLTKRLNFLTGGLVRNSDYFTKSSWILNFETDSSTPICRYAQHGYFGQGFPGKLQVFTSPEKTEPLVTVEPRTYYGYPPSNEKDGSLLFPENLNLSFDKIESLSKSDRTKFDMACSWYYQSSKVWHESHSLSFIALVTALECLFQNYEKCKDCGSPSVEAFEKCKTCGEPIFKITKTLRDFLDTHVPFIDAKKERDLIYNIRSKLAHGLEMLNRDFEQGIAVSPIRQHEEQFSRNIRYVVFVAIYNWLWSR